MLSLLYRDFQFNVFSSSIPHQIKNSTYIFQFFSIYFKVQEKKTYRYNKFKIWKWWDIFTLRLSPIKILFLETYNITTILMFVFNSLTVKQ